MRAFMLTVLMALLAAPATVRAHSAGPLDRYGCHPDRRVGDYHCHRGELRGLHFKSKAAMLEKRGQAAVAEEGTHTESADQSRPSRHEKESNGWRSWLPFGGSKRESVAPKPEMETAIVPRGIEQRLRILRDLYEKGLITEEEYATKRKEILGEL